jgi:DNA invertase Pin-like site-specific DNA recombinase
MSDRLTAAAGYIRCSTEQQEDSPDQQKQEILAYASQHGLEIVEWFVDFGKSGIDFDQRPAFQQLLKAVERGSAFRSVVCYDESRWGRAIEAEENAYWRVRFRKSRVEVLLVKTSADPGHEFAPMLQAFEGVLASQYSRKLSELTLRGGRNNGPYSRGGTPPYGYRRCAVNLKTKGRRDLDEGDWIVKKQEKTLWIPGDPAEVKIVKHIFERRVAGISLVAIAKDLNDREVPCARRGRWKNRDQKWSSGTIKSIIENPAYYGARVYGRFSSSKIRAKLEGWDMNPDTRNPQRRIPQSQWSIHEDAHEPLVQKELWLRAKSNSNDHRFSGKPRHYVPYLLTGLITCGRCGFSFQGQSTTNRGKKYYRYVCGGYNAKRVCQ